MKILSRFPTQVQILKTTNMICGLSGASKGLQRRLIDVPQTNDFLGFCTKLTEAKNKSTPLTIQLRSLGVDAKNHLDQMESDAIGFASASGEVTKLFSREEVEAIVSRHQHDEYILHKLLLSVMQLSAFIFQQHPSVRRLPNPLELINTYIFRSSLCHLLLGFQYASSGGVSEKSPAKIRNDMVDSHFATYATFFDGLLSKDRRTNWLGNKTSNLLSQFRSINMR